MRRRVRTGENAGIETQMMPQITSRISRKKDNHIEAVASDSSIFTRLMRQLTRKMEQRVAL